MFYLPFSENRFDQHDSKYYARRDNHGDDGLVRHNPGLYEACVTWIDDTFGEQLASDNIMPDELERLGLYNAAEESRNEEDYLNGE